MALSADDTTLSAPGSSKEMQTHGDAMATKRGSDRLRVIMRITFMIYEPFNSHAVQMG